jgi:uncharacterized membrane protein
MGVTIRHYFNTVHARKGNPTWTWLATAVIFLVIAWLSTAPGSQREELSGLSPQAARFAGAEGFAQVADTVVGRCSMCHASEVFWPGLHRAPKGVVLETEAQVAAHAREIYLQAGRSHAMPPGNVTGMEPAERRRIIDWYRRATAG